MADRAIVVDDARLLLVDAVRGRDDLWCAPRGGAEPHQSLPENLAREVFEETVLTVDVGAPCLVNEFHDPNGTFHQVEMFFRCTLMAGTLDSAWQDPEKIVTQRRWVTRDESAALTVRPKSPAGVAWGDTGARPLYTSPSPPAS